MFDINPWEVKGKVDYDKIIELFGAKKLDEKLLENLKPLHVLLRRKFFYAHRDFDKWVESFKKGEKISIVTGRGPSGYMHLGHIVIFHFAKWLQEKTNSILIIPFSDDEKYLVKNKNMKEIHEYTIDNIKNILALEFDPKKTRIIVDTLDPVIYDLAILFSKYINLNLVRSIFGMNFKNIGWLFYPSIQVAHLLLPQVLYGRHYTLVPVAIDQDPHTRLSRDIAERFNFNKPATILSKFFPTLEDPFGKMSSSKEEKVIWLLDNLDEVKKKIMKYAYSGGQPTLELHRKYGGNPWIDVSFLLLYYFFENDDEKIKEIEENYKKGILTTGELKKYASEKIIEFLRDFQEKRKNVEDNWEDLLEKYRLKEKEREKILDFVYSQ